MRSVFIKSIRGLLIISFLLCSSLSLASFFSAGDRFCELISHFRLVWVGLGVGFVAILFITKETKLLCVAVVVLSINVADVGKLYLPPQHVVPEGDQRTIKILTVNLAGDLLTKNTTEVLQLINEKQPDVIGFSEYSKKWSEALKPDLLAYRFCFEAGPNGDALAVFSKLPATCETKISSLAHRPRLLTMLTVQEKEILFDFAHPILPVLPELRNEELDELASDAANAVTPIIIAGDLNCTPWSYYFQRLLTRGLLSDSSQGFGPQPTWNALWLLPVLPIDHCLSSKHFRTKVRQVGPAVGSDHLPLFVEFMM